MPLSRRQLLRAGFYAGAAAAVGPSFFPTRRAGARSLTPDPSGTTLERTLLRGAATGYAAIVAGPGEAHVVREDLARVTGDNRAGHRQPLAVFAHLTDIHVLDAQSPARVEFLDRYNDVSSSMPFEAAYRPQEMLTTQLADSVIRAVARLRRGPVTGRKIEFSICTGDNIDNAQLNELRWYIDLLDGGLITPDSGAADRWEGVHDQHPESYQVDYWHPGGTPAGKVDDNPRRLHGFPTIPGLLDAARRPFQAHGVAMPWYTAFGNHDPLLQGNAPRTPAFEAVAVGPLKVVGLAPGLTPEALQRGLAQADPAVIQAQATAPARTVTADAGRRTVSRAEIIEQHFVTTGTPVGHGFDRDSGVAYYAFDHSETVRGIVLDTVAYGYADGSLDTAQFAWLLTELDRARDERRIVFVFSHHTIDTMVNPAVGPDDTGPRVQGDEVRALLVQYDNVIAWVNGHTHTNAITAQGSPGAGFWEISTAAHIDWPNQARVIELVDNRDGTMSIFTTNVDADAPLSSAQPLASAVDLAALARELAANDWQARDSRRGGVEARNAELLVPFPTFAAAQALAAVDRSAS